MKKSFLLAGCCLIIVISTANSPVNRTDTSKLPRIAIAGIAIETSTFSPAQTNEAAFHAKYGKDGFTSYPFLSADSPLYKKAIWIPTVVARALPGGIVTREAYESIVKKTLDSLKANSPLDGIYLDIHGAMSVVGLDDPEGDYIKRIRKVVGKKPLISMSMDLHGNVSWRLAENADLITAYRKAPHEDALETKERAMTELVSRLLNGKGKKPYKAYVSIPVLLPGEKTSTRIEPAKSVYAAVTPASQQTGIIDASLWVGYAWADEPRDHAVAMAIGDDKKKTLQTAQQLAKLFWDARFKYAFVAPTGTLEQCLNSALHSAKKPFYISDCGDNPTAGASGDVTWTLHKLIERPEFKNANGPSLIYASIPGPELVKAALAAGIGHYVEGFAGAAVDNRYAGPVKISGTVLSIVKGNVDAEVEVVIKEGSLQIIVTQKRKSYRTEGDFTSLGLKPRDVDIVMVKLGYLDPELYAMQKDWMMALTPGGADQDIEHLPFKRIQRPMFPFDKNMPEPDLSAKLVPSSDDVK